MTITSIVNKVQISSGTAITITNLEVTASSQLVVTRLESDDSETTLVETTDYTVDSTFDTLTLLVAIDGTIFKRASVTVDIPETQTSDYVNINPHNTEVTEADLDKMTLKLKEVQEKLDRVIAAPISTPTGTFDLPILVGNAGKFLKLNATENGFDFAAITSVTFWEDFIFPVGDGTANQVLKTDGSLNLDWITPEITNYTGVTIEAILNYNHATATINKSLNVTSVSDDGTGKLTITFTTAITNTDYGVAVTSRSSGVTNPSIAFIPSSGGGSDKTTTTLTIHTQEGGSLVDSPEVMVIAYT